MEIFHDPQKLETMIQLTQLAQVTQVIEVLAMAATMQAPQMAKVRASRSSDTSTSTCLCDVSDVSDMLDIYVCHTMEMSQMCGKLSHGEPRSATRCAVVRRVSVALRILAILALRAPCIVSVKMTSN